MLPAMPPRKFPSSLALLGSLVLAGGAFVALRGQPAVAWKNPHLASLRDLATLDWSHLFDEEKKAPAAAAATAAETALPEVVTFNAHIQPIFSENCYHCHGPVSGSRKADLRLDRAEFAFKPLKSGQPAIIKGQAAASEVLRRMRHKDPKEVMPPPATHKVISQRDIALVEKWINQSASYEEHWSLIPPQRPPVPSVPDSTWAKPPVDSFILASLQKNALTPAPEADKPALLRRVTLDLTGLLLTSLATFHAAPTEGTSSKPNVVIIVADGQSDRKSLFGSWEP